MAKCGYCGQNGAEFLCGSCRIMSYCNSKCADADWYIAGEHANDHNDEKEHIMDLILGSGKKNAASIFLGSVDALYEPSVLSHIDSIVSVLGENYDDITVREAVNAGRAPNNQRWHLRVTIWDDEKEDIAQYFDLVADWMKDQMIAGRHLLIHCVAGHSRSTTLLIYYMIKWGGFKSVDKALSYIRKRRPTAHPNSGFMKQLRAAQNPEADYHAAKQITQKNVL